MSILILEDNLVSSTVIKFALKKNGFSSITAPTASQAIDQLSRRDDIEAIICDIMLPEMDGLAFVRTLRTIDEWRSLPVLFCSSRSDAATIRAAAELGSRHYVLKPVTEGSLIGKLREVLGTEKADERSPHDDGDVELQEAREVTTALSRLMVSKTRQLTALRQGGGRRLTYARVFEEFAGVAEAAKLFGAGLGHILQRMKDKSGNPGAGPTESELRTLLVEWDILQTTVNRSAKRGYWYYFTTPIARHGNDAEEERR